MNFKAIAGALAILACGVVKDVDARPLTVNDCEQQGIAAFALAKARDNGRPREMFLKYVAEQEPEYKHKVMTNIINHVFDNDKQPAEQLLKVVEQECKRAIK